MKEEKRITNKGQIIKDKLFIYSIIALPVIVWATLYIGGNITMVLTAFQEYDPITKTYSFVGFINFKEFFIDLFNEPLLEKSAINSFIVYGVELFLMMPINILVSYCIYKRIYGAGFFKVVLFLPSIISGIIWVLLFKYLLENGVPALFPEIKTSLLTNDDTAFSIMLGYKLWLGFAKWKILIVSVFK